MRRHLTIAALVSLIGSLASSGQPANAADPGTSDTPAAFADAVRVVETSALGIDRPSGIAWSPSRRAFVVVDDGATTGRLMTPLGDGAGTVSLPDGATPSGLAFDQTRGRLVGDTRAAGAAVDRNGRLWLLDAAARRVSRGDGGADFILGPAVARPRGLAIHPSTGHLFTLDAQTDDLVEIDADGRIVAVRDLTEAGLRDPRALVIAPSADPTDDASVMHLYIADAGTAAAEGTTGAGIHEIALAPTPQVSILASTGSLVRTINTFQWDPASPDPSGLAYNSDDDRLVLVDGEVEETTGAGFNGANGWLATRLGSVTDTFDVTDFNTEPVGVAYDPAANRYFISNDSARRVWVINPGGDGLPGTGDDTTTSFLTNGFGSGDPEGLAFGGGDLFIADGVGKEVFRVDPGPNSTFQGGADDVITQFDVASMGQSDPEGIDYDPATGHLWVISNDDATSILEVTPGGVAVRTIDLTFSVVAPGGLAIAPATSGSGHHVYVADRGVDNNNDPTENDGRIYEIEVTGDADPQTGTLALPNQPIRLIDTRFGVGLSGRFTANSYRSFNVAGSPSIPDNAIAITGNVTVVNPDAGGYVSVLTAPVSGTPPISNVNFPKGATRPNNFVAPLSSTGSVSIVYKAAAGARTHLILDVTGYFVSGTAGGRYVELEPARILDSRDGTGVDAIFSSDEPQTFDVAGLSGIPNNATAVAGNLTVAGATAGGFASVTTNPDATPATSTLNFSTGEATANGIIVGLSGGGSLSAVVSNSGGSAHLIFDVTGYFVEGSGGAVFHPVEPSRVLDTRIDVGLSNSFQAGTARSLDLTPGALANGTVGITGNLTVVEHTKSGYVSVTPTPNNDPSTSTINVVKGDTRANGITAPLTSAGVMSFVYKAGTSTTARTDLLLDVTGYFQ